jgi:hypothetical protein
MFPNTNARADKGVRTNPSATSNLDWQLQQGHAIASVVVSSGTEMRILGSHRIGAN